MWEGGCVSSVCVPVCAASKSLAWAIVLCQRSDLDVQLPLIILDEDVRGAVPQALRTLQVGVRCVRRACAVRYSHNLVGALVVCQGGRDATTRAQSAQG
jgi:hypothetical protein